MKFSSVSVPPRTSQIRTACRSKTSSSMLYLPKKSLIAGVKTILKLFVILDVLLTAVMLTYTSVVF